MGRGTRPGAGLPGTCARGARNMYRGTGEAEKMTREKNDLTRDDLYRPNSYIGRSVPRPNLARLTQGRAQFVSDMTLPRLAHVAFVRSPHAHARIAAIAMAAAARAPGVVAVVNGAELAKVITPWIGVLTHLKGIKSAPQHA